MTLVADDAGGEYTFELSETPTAETKSIEPGSFAMLCPIESKQGPHYKLGQLEGFSIE